MSTRLIHRSAASPSRIIAETLEGLLLAEMVAPGNRLLVVSPWISEFPAIDNRAGQYSTLEPAWLVGFVPFSSVLRSLLTHGVKIRVACGFGERETDFISRLSNGATLDGTQPSLSVSQLPREHRLFSHEKAMVADTWAIYGSMNMTYSGVKLNGELITVTTETDTVGRVATELLGLFS